MIIATKKRNFIVFEIFLLIYIILIIYNLLNGSQWIIDNVLSIGFLIIIFFTKEILLIGRKEFILFNIALLMHNLGSFGFYSWNNGFFEYDNIVHLISSMVAGFIVLNYIYRRFSLENKTIRKQNLFEKNKIFMVFLAISAVVMLGTLIEIAEFFGYSFLGYGEGLMFVGPGDGNIENYTDTMTDILVNLIGSIIGAMIYYTIFIKDYFIHLLLR